MSFDDHQVIGIPHGGPQFTTTHWSVVLSAVDRASPDSEAALARLCQTYWYPLYAYVRRRGNSPEDAQDLTQSFFASLLEKKYLERADRERGRFRTFLLSSLENFLHNERDRASAQKRGGGHTLVSWDEQDAEGRYLNEPVDNTTPERIFEKRWAATLLEEVLKRLRQEFVANGKTEFFDQLKPHVWSETGATPYSELATRLNMTTVAIKVTVHRLRQRYRDLLRAEIAQTVASPEDIDDEIRHLIEVMSG